MGIKDQMIEAYERGYCSYERSYDFVREQMIDNADLERKRRKETGFPVSPKKGSNDESSSPKSSEQAEADGDADRADHPQATHPPSQAPLG